MICHVISQASTIQESNFGTNNVSFEINFREKNIFKYVHVQMALRFLKKNINLLVLWWNTASWSCRTFIQQLQIIKNLLVKALWLRSLPKAVKKKLGWSTIFHELKGVVKAKIAQNNSQHDFWRRNYSQTRSRFHSWIDYLKSEPICRFCNL